MESCERGTITLGECWPFREAAPGESSAGVFSALETSLDRPMKTIMNEPNAKKMMVIKGEEKKESL